MLLLTSGFSTLASLFKLVLLLLLFLGLLFAASWFTKWYAGSAMVKNRNRNISILESYPMGPGKSIHIARIGTKYIAFAVSKEQISVLTELSEEELDLEPLPMPKQGSFKDMFTELMERKKKQEK